jgi:hypothetical protein
MPIIAYYPDHAEARNAFNLLESRGVPTYLKNVGNRVWRHRTALVVLFPEQVEDAVALLQDPDHEVRNPVDMELFRQVEASGESWDVMLKWLVFVLLGLVGLIVLLFLVG